jgi:hypothetical protein
MTDIIEAKVTNGVITHKDTSGEIFRYTAVRCGLSWPSAEASGFYVVLGEEWRGPTIYEGREGEKGKLILLKEQEIESPLLNELLPRITDDCTQFACEKVYTDLSENFEGYAEFYHRYIYDKNINYGRLCDAPYSDAANFLLGVSIIKIWLKDVLLELPPDSLTRNQLRGLSDEDLKDSPEVKFPAVNALRHSVNAFYKFRPSNLIGWTPNRS